MPLPPMAEWPQPMEGNISRIVIVGNIFTALHVMQTRYCDEISVRLSVCLSVCHTRGL